jgi:2-haloacid dehalogenase
MPGMPMPASRPALRAVLFDAYGTLFDVQSVALAAEQRFPGHGAALARLWRERQIDYTRIVSMSGRWRPFWELTQAALVQAAALLALPLSAADSAALMNEYHHLSAYPENAGVLAALKARGVRAGVLSNGDPSMLAVAVRSAGFAAWLDPLLSVTEVERFKTDPAAYALGPKALGLPAAEILFVSSNAWDAIGATWFGYTTLWVNRAGVPPDPLGTAPTHEATSLAAVLDFFPESHPAADTSPTP